MKGEMKGSNNGKEKVKTEIVNGLIENKMD